MTPSPDSRQYVRQALEHYASFFASLAKDDEESAAQSLLNIKSNDSEADEILSPNDLDYYRTRKTYLMKIFRDQLMVQLEGQIQQDLFERAQTLAKQIEIESI